MVKWEIIQKPSHACPPTTPRLSFEFEFEFENHPPSVNFMAACLTKMNMEEKDKKEEEEGGRLVAFWGCDAERGGM